MHDALIVLAKLPVPGLAKTRLARDIGPEPAAHLAEAFLKDTLETCARCTGAELCVCYWPDAARDYFAELAPAARLVEQAAGDLGARLGAAFDEAFARGATRAVVIGTDTPQLSADVLAEAFATLAEADLVLGPAADGGYSLIGLRAPRPELFRGIAWSTPRVLDETLACAAGLVVARTRELFDVDDRDGLERLERWLATAGAAACRHTARALAGWRARARGLGALLGAGLLTALAGCATVDFDYPKEESHALGETGDTELGRMSASLTPKEPGDGLFYLIPDGIEALAARLVMAQHAERCIDAQYYLIKADTAGLLFIDALLAAADRGVRVRLLLDDSDTAGYDRGLLALDDHPNVEVRIFNPFVRAFSRMLRAGLDFRRVNRRMHNKSFTADNQVTVIGGRNIGGEYFNARPDYNFGDLDVLCFGPVVQEVSDMFDLYWNDVLAVPVPGVIDADPEEAEQLRATFRERVTAGWRAAQDTLFASALKETMLAPARDASVLVSAPYQLVYDPPEKARAEADGDETILGPLGRTLEGATDEFLLVSPYFVPLKSGIDFFEELRARGITCKVVTNSLASTNQAIVHTGYYPAREPLLKLGVELYEVRPDVVVTGGERSEAKSSRACLHTKAFMVDRQHLFIGSFNFDPRSAYINTEMGIVIDSAVLCAQVARRVDEGLPTTTYRVVLNEKGYLRWIATDGGVETVHIREPAGYWRKVYVSFMGLWPIQRQL